MLKIIIITILGLSLLSCEEGNSASEKSQDDGYSYLSFPNFEHFGIGRCRANALLTQKLSVLATCEPQVIECLNSIKEGMTKILNFETHTFNGFNNLWEFSNTPGIKK